jgi:hypothetical protein
MGGLSCSTRYSAENETQDERSVDGNFKRPDRVCAQIVTSLLSPGVRLWFHNALQRENRELTQANEILWKAPAFCARAELDRQRNRWCPSSTRTGKNMGSSRFTVNWQSPRRRISS